MERMHYLEDNIEHGHMILGEFMTEVASNDMRIMIAILLQSLKKKTCKKKTQRSCSIEHIFYMKIALITIHIGCEKR